MKKVENNWLILLISVLLVFLFYILKVNEEYSMDADHCKALTNYLNGTQLDIFELKNITNNDFELTISFSLNKTQDYYYDYYEDSGIIEIKEVLSIIDIYLDENDLNEKICCVFYLTPGDGMCIYNYDYREENAEIIYNDFAFF